MLFAVKAGFLRGMDLLIYLIYFIVCSFPNLHRHKAERKLLKY